MAWQSRFISSGSLAVALEELETFLDGLNSLEAACAKIAMGDQEGASAKGLVLWNEDITEIPSKPTGAWSRQTYHTNEVSQYREAGEDIAAKLNELSLSQAFWAKLVVADAKKMAGQTVLFYPTNG